MSKILPIDWSADFAKDGEHEKSRMKEATNESASFIYSLNLGSKELPIEEYVKLAEENFLLMWSTTCLSWWIWHGVEKSIWV